MNNCKGVISSISSMCRVRVWSIFGPFLFWAVEKSFLWSPLLIGCFQEMQSRALRRIKWIKCCPVPVGPRKAETRVVVVAAGGLRLGHDGLVATSSGFLSRWDGKVGVQFWREFKISRFVAFPAAGWQSWAAGWVLIPPPPPALSSVSYTYLRVYIHMYVCKKAKPKEYKRTNSCNK